MVASFYFYDLETSGFNPKAARIMQFAGQRTDLNLKPIGQPDNFLIKLTDDVLPDPSAVLVHSITPQKTKADGITEAEFLKYFNENILKPNTIFTGFNNIRFDNDFMRFTFWRNFYDAYEWAWKDGCGTWDLMDVARMTRALRPAGIKWPFAPDGKPSVRLELLAAVNKLEHANAHDALSDVMALIDLARLIKNKQPKLFDYLLNMRDKKKVEPLVNSGKPLVYTSGRYPNEYEKTTVVAMVAPQPQRSAALVYDLRVDPDEFSGLSSAQLAKLWQLRGEDAPYFPVKVLSYNKCPAIAPLSVLDDPSLKRLKLDKKVLATNLKKLQAAKDFGPKLAAALDIMWPKDQTQISPDPLKVDEQLYDGFVPDSDKTKMSVVRAADVNELSNLKLDFADERLKLLLPLYKARNFPKILSGEELDQWEAFRTHKLLDGGEASRTASFFKNLQELSAQPGLTSEQQYLLEELNLYAQSIVPAA